MSGVMEIFEEYPPQDKDPKVFLSGDIRDWVWFKILVFTEKKIYLIKELGILNNLWQSTRRIDMKNFQFALRNSPFCLSKIFWFYFKGKKSEAMSFNFMVNFWTTVGENGGMTWTVTEDKISALYYFNDENLFLEIILFLLNNFAFTYRLDAQGWKLPSRMTVSNSEHWNYDYVKRIEFICRK